MSIIWCDRWVADGTPTIVTFLPYLNPFCHPFSTLKRHCASDQHKLHEAESWETNRFSASQEILCVLHNLKARYPVHKKLQPVPNQSLNNPVHVSPSHYFKIHFNIIPTSMLRSSVVSFSQVSPLKPCTHFSSLPLCATCSAYLILLLS